MAEIHNFDALQVKLQKVCKENELEYELSTSGYPISLTVFPNKELAGQTSLLPDDEQGMGANARITFSMVDGDLIVGISEKMVVDDTLLTKLRSLFKSLHYVYLQIFHRNAVNGGY